MWKYRTPGIPDELFQRAEEIPMTKEEIRALTISKARLKTGDNVIDVGCGTGSLTVEASIQVTPGGKVYAIDREKKAIDLTQQNLDNFGFKNTVQLIHGEATMVLGSLPAADAILIGSGGEHLTEIINLASMKLKPEGRVVINAILLETIYAATKELAKAGFKDIEATQISVAKGRWTQKGTIMISRNPIMIISATK
jgi:cobalt-precorrin-6B (C15)-methyltransferase